jgi:hypothetical protein
VGLLVDGAKDGSIEGSAVVGYDVLGAGVNDGWTVGLDVVGSTVGVDVVGLNEGADVLGSAVGFSVVGSALGLKVVGSAVGLFVDGSTVGVSVDGGNDGSSVDGLNVEGLNVEGLNVDGSIVGTSVVGLIVGSETGANEGVSVGGGESVAKLMRICITPNKANNTRVLHTIMVENEDSELDNRRN